MYRIEVVPGEETVFRTLEELAVGIRNGLVTPRARIFHNASQKWLPIGLHPHYKKAMELPATSSAQTKTPTPLPSRAPAKLRVESHLPEHPPEPKPAAATRIPDPVTSPVVAMQQEVLRDLPVVMIPEPLPWARRPAPVEPSAPPPEPEPEPEPEPVVPMAHPVQSQPTAIVTYTPSPQTEPVQAEPVESEPVQPEPVSPWPQFEPLEESHPRPTARRSKRSRGRPVVLLGVAAALVLAGHFVLRAAPAASTDFPEGTEPEEVVSEPTESATPAEKPAPRVAPAPAAVATPPNVSRSPARVRMTPGPAFAGSVPAQPGADTVTPRAQPPAAAAASAPADPAADAPSIAPAPVELELALPDLKTDPVAPARSGDTTSMKKILRALNGSKP